MVSCRLTLSRQLLPLRPQQVLVHSALGLRLMLCWHAHNLDVCFTVPQVTAGNSWELELKTFFAQHYMGCQSCNGQNRDNELDLCLHEYKKAFKFAVQRQIPAFEAHKHGVEREASLQRQLIKLPYCKLDPDAPLCQSEVISGNSTAFLSHL